MLEDVRGKEQLFFTCPLSDKMPSNGTVRFDVRTWRTLFDGCNIFYFTPEVNVPPHQQKELDWPSFSLRSLSRHLLKPLFPFRSSISDQNNIDLCQITQSERPLLPKHSVQIFN